MCVRHRRDLVRATFELADSVAAVQVDTRPHLTRNMSSSRPQNSWRLVGPEDLTTLSPPPDLTQAAMTAIAPTKRPEGIAISLPTRDHASDLACLSPKPPGQRGADGTDAVGGPVQGDGGEQTVAAHAEQPEKHTCRRRDGDSHRNSDDLREHAVSEEV